MASSVKLEVQTANKGGVCGTTSKKLGGKDKVVALVPPGGKGASHPLSQHLPEPFLHTCCSIEPAAGADGSSEQQGVTVVLRLNGGAGGRSSGGSTSSADAANQGASTGSAAAAGASSKGAGGRRSARQQAAAEASAAAAAAAAEQAAVGEVLRLPLQEGAELLRPILAAAPGFKVEQLQGLSALPEPAQAAVLSALVAGAEGGAEAGGEEAGRPAKRARTAAKGPQANSRAAGKRGKGKGAEEGDEEEEKEGKGRGRVGRSTGQAGTGSDAAAAAADRGAAGDAEEAGEGVSGGSEEGEDYEAMRAAQIAKNRERMAALQLHGLGAAVAAAAAPAAKAKREGERGLANSKRSKPDPSAAPPPRRSGRVRGVAADPSLAAGIDYETAKGGVVLASGAAGLFGGSEGEEGGSLRRGRHPKGPLPFRSQLAGDDEEEEGEKSEGAKVEDMKVEGEGQEVKAEAAAEGAGAGAAAGAASAAVPAPRGSDAAFLASLRAASGITTASSSSKGSAPEVGPAGPIFALNAIQAGAGDEDNAGAAAKSTKAAKEGSSSGKAECAAPAKGPMGLKQASKLQLKGADVAKVCKDGVSHLQWHPGTDRLIVAAGDKEGRLGLWQVDWPEGQGSAGFDGVLDFEGVHYQYISGLRWCGARGTQLLTASYDGSLRLLDVGQGVFQDLTPGISDGLEIASMDVDEAGNIAFLGDNQGYLEVVDLRAGKSVLTGLGAHDKRINTLHLAPSSASPGAGPGLLLTSSSDTRVSVWDARVLSSSSSSSTSPSAASGGSKKKASAKPLAEAQHQKACQAAYWEPGGAQRVLSTSFDDTLTIWSLSASGKSLDRVRAIKHDNQTGRWVTPFRAVWSPAGDAVLCGNMSRAVDVFSAATGALEGQLRSPELMTAIPSRIAAHPSLPVLVGATNSGRLHVWR